MKQSNRLARLVAHNIERADSTLSYERLTLAMTRLAQAVHADPEPEWDYDANGAYSALADIITAAYWHYAGLHSGQGSDSYAALCALSAVFCPGPYATGPDSESAEADIYAMLNEWAAA